jgi:hypothetical protein
MYKTKAIQPIRKTTFSEVWPWDGCVFVVMYRVVVSRRLYKYQILVPAPSRRIEVPGTSSCTWYYATLLLPIRVLVDWYEYQSKVQSNRILLSLYIRTSA